MAIKIAQTKTGTSTLASTAITLDSNTVNGNTIVVAVATNIGSDVSTITDSQGNAYSKAFAAPGTGIGAELWFATNIVGGVVTVTVNYTTGATAAAIIQEYSGIDTITVLDKTATSSGNSSSLSSTATSNTNQQLELCVGVGALISGTLTAGGSFVNLTQAANATINVGIEDLMVTSIGSNTATFTGNASGQWSCGVASFRASPQGTTTSTSSTSSSSTSASTTSFSTSSTSTSLSTSSTSISTTSVSTSSTSSSISTSSTSSSISSTSSSISSTSISSTSNSTSISSTSSSISSTSFSSTSISSTSASTSISSTSSSFSSTSSSVSSTSASTSSTSFSSTSSSSSTSTTTLPLPNLVYSYEDVLGLPNGVQTARVQATSGVNATGGSANIVSTAFGSSIRDGNTIIVGLAYDSTATACSGVTDSNGNTYTKVQASSRRGCEIWVCYQVKGGANNVVTATLSFVDGVVFCEEWAGIYPNGFDAGANGTATIVNPSIATVPTTQANEVVFAVVLNDVNTTTYTAGASYSNLVTGSPSFCYGASESKIITAKGSQVAGFVGGTGGNSWDLAVATFKAQPVNVFSILNYSNVSGDDADYFIEYGSEYMIRNYQCDWTNNTDIPSFTWRGRTTIDTRISPMFIQIYNVNSVAWETLAVANTIPPDTDFSVTVKQSTNISNYYDSFNIVTFRSYQQVI